MDLDPDLYSRQLRVWGFDVANFMKKVSNDILIVGMKGLGIEIAKNVIHNGVRSVTVHNTEPFEIADLSSQFYLSEADVGSTTSAKCMSYLTELNRYTRVFFANDALDEIFLSRFKVVVLTNNKSVDEMIRINHICRKNNSYFIVADTRGAFGTVFCDFGGSFTVYDKDGEEPCYGIVTDITKDNQGIVTLHDDKKHSLEDEDYVRFDQVKGMTEINSTANQLKLFKVKVLDACTFSIGDTSAFGEYKGGGLMTQVKSPTYQSFLPLSESLQRPSFMESTADIFGQPEQLHVLYQSLFIFQREQGRLPKPGNKEHAEHVLEIARGIAKGMQVSLDDDLIRRLAMTSAGQLCPMASVIGGIASQEVLKACTGKFKPIQQWFYFDASDILPDNLTEDDLQPVNSRYDGQIAVLGREFQDKLSNMTQFLVGAGCVGCEYLKNFAMMGLGTGKRGSIILADNDCVEKHNLTLQFLYRNFHIGMEKATVAGKAIKEFNPQINITTIPFHVNEQNTQCFSDSFWESIDGVCTAVDNVQSRCYIGDKCTFYLKPHIDVGIHGPKGHVQVSIPHLTETYSCSQDVPVKAIPMSTRGSFPYYIQHTIDWGKDTFDRLFCDMPVTLKKIIDHPEDVLKTDVSTSTLKDIVTNMLDDNRCIDFADCVRWARLLFEEFFSNTIKSLLFSFPLDLNQNDGRPFWSGAKRAPTPITFDINDPMHMKFVVAASFLRAATFGIPSHHNRHDIVDMIQKVRVPKWYPVQVLGPANQQAAQAQANSNSDPERDELLRRLSHVKDIKVNSVSFEEYNVDHLDFVEASANLRARIFQIPEADRFKIRMIVLNVIPCLITTAAAMSGLGCLELYKIVQGKRIEHHKNYFANLAVPLFIFSEPQPPAKKYLNGNPWTIWDKLTIDGDPTLEELLQHFKEKHNVNVSGVVLCATAMMLYFYFQTKTTREQRLKMKISELCTTVGKLKLHSGQKYVVLDVVGEDDQNEDVDLPRVCVRLL